MKLRIALLAALLPLTAAADEPRVWFDTDRGPIIVQLDTVKAPLTSEHFLEIVADKHYDGLIFNRTVKDFVIQTGRFDVNGSSRLRDDMVIDRKSVV